MNRIQKTEWKKRLRVASNAAVIAFGLVTAVVRSLVQAGPAGQRLGATSVALIGASANAAIGRPSAAAAADPVPLDGVPAPDHRLLLVQVSPSGRYGFAPSKFAGDLEIVDTQSNRVIARTTQSDAVLPSQAMSGKDEPVHLLAMFTVASNDPAFVHQP